MHLPGLLCVYGNPSAGSPFLGPIPRQPSPTAASAVSPRRRKQDVQQAHPGGQVKQFDQVAGTGVNSIIDSLVKSLCRSS